MDYEYYKTQFKGSDLTEEEFEKYGNLACMEITTNTLSRVTDLTIGDYPKELISRIKDCACSIANYKKAFDNAFNSIVGAKSGSGAGVIRSKSVGAVSVSYDTSQTASYLLDPAKQKQLISSVLRLYLSPVCFGGVMYNLLSKNLNFRGCRAHTVI